MSINLNDNFNVSAPLPIDSRYGNGSSLPFTSYTTTTSANASISAGQRYVGLTVLVGTPAVEYWYRTGTTDADLIPKFYNFTNSGTGFIQYFFQDTTPTRYSQIYSDRYYTYMEAGDLPNLPVGTATGTKSRVISFKSIAGLWTNDYSSYAYEASARYVADHPWVTMDDTHSFQIYDGIVSTTKDGSTVARYFDERVGNPAWQETYNNRGASYFVLGRTYTLSYYNEGDDFSGMTVTTVSGTINTSGWVFTYTSGSPTTWTSGSIVTDTLGNRFSGATTLINGQVYTLTTLAGGDNFNNSIGTTYPGTTGTPTSPPWTFTSNGTQPATWSNGSIVEGDFPYISEDQKSSKLIAEVATSGTFSGKGVLSVRTNALNCYGMLDQSFATRGIVPASLSSVPASPTEGEIIYNTATSRLNYWDGTTWRVI